MTSMRPQIRTVRLLRLLDARHTGLTVAELARAVAVSVGVVAGDLQAIREADEPLDATGPLVDPHTVVRLAR